MAKATGVDILNIARPHVGERYVFGVVVPKNNPSWKGPWDCAEFTPWVAFQAAGRLFGCPGSNPSVANAFTGYWRDDADSMACSVPVIVARNMPGAFLLRYAVGNQPGHIVVTDGQGGTVEAHSSADGVIAGKVDGRRWDRGILPPFIAYDEPDAMVPAQIGPGLVLRVKSSPMRGELVKRVQLALAAKGFAPGDIDASYGPHTAAAVAAFQLTCGLVADGEAGPTTRARLSLA